MNKKEEKSPVKKPLILVVNDDGINAKGLRMLGDIAQQFGQVVMIAPNNGRSGMSHAITFALPLRLRKISSSKDFEMYKTSGTPVDAVKLALNYLLKDQQVDLLVSGINHGANTSVSVIYSATVAAAIEGCLSGVPSVAFSMVNYNNNCDFKAAQSAIQKIIQTVLEKGLPPHICLNVNIPNVPENEIKGIKITRQAINEWHESIVAREYPADMPYFWMGGSLLEKDKAKDTDHWAVKHNYISIHPINIDWTDYSMIHELKKWKIK
ncbi:MAG: 5'/3'-nucleotidase SurE [Bacteroidales bacterium]|jgi:5'-nucleotidase|nr:5'/3'-nucleotidase SurE [Bacteroidales bacterium]